MFKNALIKASVLVVLILPLVGTLGALALPTSGAPAILWAVGDDATELAGHTGTANERPDFVPSWSSWDGTPNKALSGWEVAPHVSLAPHILSIRPSEGYGHLPSDITICGEGFVADTTISIQVSETITLSNQATYGEDCLVGTIPAGLADGEHTILVQGPDGQDSATYRVLPEDINDDLWADGGKLSESPAFGARENEDIQVALTLHRRRGRVPLKNVTVRFYEGNPQELRAVLIGDGHVPFWLCHRLCASASGQISGINTPLVDWVPSRGPGEYTLYGVIDPDNQVQEEIESNNVVSRTVQVLPHFEGVDEVAPSVDVLQINEGATTSSEQEVTLHVESQDVAQEGVSPSGVTHMQVVEYLFHEAAFVWVPVKSSEWLTFTQQSTWDLHPRSGFRVIQAWTADEAGNISRFANQKWVNYAPPCAPIVENDTHVYRQYVEAGETLQVEVTPCVGDADLHIWPPDWYEGQPSFVSNQPLDAIETLQITDTVSGEYQIEVYGFTDAQYNMQIEVKPGQNPPRLPQPFDKPHGPPSDKPTPEAPTLPTNHAPNPSTMQAISPLPLPFDLPEPPFWLYLPAITR